MKPFIHGILSLTILAILSTGCSPMKGSIRSVKVEQASPTEVGVSLESVPATVYANAFDDRLYSSKDSAVLTPAEVGTSDTLARPSLNVAARTAVAPEVQLGSQYYYVSNKDINNALKEKLAGSYIKLLDLYQSAISNNKSLSLVPQLNVYYQFKAKIGADLYSESISFPLYDAFNYSGALLRVTGAKMEVFWGKGRLEKVISSAKLAANSSSPVIANIFDLSDKVEFFRVSDSNIFGYDRVSGGNMFAVGFNGAKFQLSGLGTLPVVADTQRVESKRVDAIIAAKLGLKLNSRIFFYGDSKAYVSHIYSFGSDFLFKELKGQCGALKELGYIPEGLQCAGAVIAEPVLTDSVMMDAVMIKK